MEAEFDATNSQHQPEPLPANKPNGFRRTIWRLTKWIAIPFVLYVLFILVGLIPVNNDYQPPDQGIDIFVVSNEVHADFVLPIVTDIMDWRDCFPPEHFPGNVNSAKYVLIGWGDRGFFLETPTWGDLKVSTAAHALLWPSATCLHVSQTPFEEWDAYGVRVRITAERYRELVAFIRETFADIDPGVTRDQRPLDWSRQIAECQIPAVHYATNDTFYRAHGRYHAMNTCNSWIGRGLRTAGVRVGAWTPLPKSVYFYLPKLEK